MQIEKMMREKTDSQATKIKIISAPDRAVEVRAVAREIKRLVIEAGFLRWMT